MNNKAVLGLLVLIAAVAIGGYALNKSGILNKKIKPADIATGLVSKNSPTPTQKPEYTYIQEDITGIPYKPGEVNKGGIVEQPESGTKVTLNDNGFTPNIITVRENTAVTFVNNSGDGMWIASAPHPAHTDLPGFDQKQSVNKGGKFTYTFTQVGTWKFHNHANPADTGIVVVTK